MKPEIINMRNQKPFEEGRIVNISYLSKQFSEMHPSNAVDALSEEVQSLHDAVMSLEQRLTILEEELKK